jgi:hypothetical protein
MSGATGYIQEHLGAWREFPRELHRHPKLDFAEHRIEIAAPSSLRKANARSAVRHA